MMMKLQAQNNKYLVFFSLLIFLIGCHQKLSSELQGDWNILKSSFEALQPIYGYSQSGDPITKTAKTIYFKSGNIGVSKDPLAMEQVTFEKARYRVSRGGVEIFDSNELDIDGVYTLEFSIVEETNLMKKIRLELRNDSLGFIVLTKTYLKSDLFQ